MSRDISYHLLSGGQHGVDNVVALFADKPEPVKQADSRHPHWDAILKGLADDDVSVYDMFDVHKGVVTALTKLSDRVSWNGRDILFDGDPQEGPLAEHLVRCIEAGVKDYGPVVRFWEKVATNPDKRSREQLFTWLQSHNFTITEDGDILGYKGVVSKADSSFLSIHRGTAYVDGKEITGQIPNNPGTVVTMPRSKVKNDPNSACSYGLHVGDWSYASSFAQGAVLEVHVNPRDVVSIPSDSGQRKMRACKYKVVKVRDKATASPIDVGDEKWEGDVGYVVEDVSATF